MHWAEQYIGRPWVSGARGPLAFDCWGLVWYIYKHHFGITLPLFSGAPANDHREVLRVMREQQKQHNMGEHWSDWSQVPAPADGDAVAMAGTDSFSHVGVWLALSEGGSVLHCASGRGVMLSTVSQLGQMGFSKINFYHHAAHR